jgi:N-acetylglutamate synthase-like GNAT family acetyltransferase
MTAYVLQAWESGRKAIFLLCKTHLISFYEKFGFEWACKSASTHGGAEWHEMAAQM